MANKKDKDQNKLAKEKSAKTDSVIQQINPNPSEDKGKEGGAENTAKSVVTEQKTDASQRASDVVDAAPAILLEEEKQQEIGLKEENQEETSEDTPKPITDIHDFLDPETGEIFGDPRLIVRLDQFADKDLSGGKYFRRARTTSGTVVIFNEIEEKHGMLYALKQFPTHYGIRMMVGSKELVIPFTPDPDAENKTFAGMPYQTQYNSFIIALRRLKRNRIALIEALRTMNVLKMTDEEKLQAYKAKKAAKEAALRAQAS